MSRRNMDLEVMCNIRRVEPSENYTNLDGIMETVSHIYHSFYHNKARVSQPPIQDTCLNELRLQRDGVLGRPDHYNEICSHGADCSRLLGWLMIISNRIAGPDQIAGSTGEIASIRTNVSKKYLEYSHRILRPRTAIVIRTTPKDRSSFVTSCFFFVLFHRAIYFVGFLGMGRSQEPDPCWPIPYHSFNCSDLLVWCPDACPRVHSSKHTMKKADFLLECLWAARNFPWKNLKKSRTCC